MYCHAIQLESIRIYSICEKPLRRLSRLLEQQKTACVVTQLDNGQVVSSVMLRQMEFDADRHDAPLAGSHTFEVAVGRLAVLSVAAQAAQSDLREFYH